MKLALDNVLTSSKFNTYYYAICNTRIHLYGNDGSDHLHQVESVGSTYRCGYCCGRRYDYDDYK